MPASPRLWVERLTLTGFRSYPHLTLETGPEPQVLVGPNGAGKTNLLEAVALLAPGQGLRRAPFSDLGTGGQAQWAVAARMHTALGVMEVGTGIDAARAGAQQSGRVVRIDGESKGGSGVLAEYVEMVWLTPAMDGLFTGPASERRRFLDRLILCFDPAFGRLANRYERAMQSRNRLLADGVRDDAHLAGFELQLAETGTAIAAARAEAIDAMAQVIGARRDRDPASPFPWAAIAIEGTLEADVALRSAVEVEDAYRLRLARDRERDRGAGRTLEGPHRSDLVVRHGPKDMPARFSSTGEQKALLLGLVLAHAELIAERSTGHAPILLLDEVTAHLDELRRSALFAEIVRLRAQAWMTGTDATAFSDLAGTARQWRVDGGCVAAEAVPDARSSS